MKDDAQFVASIAAKSPIAFETALEKVSNSPVENVQQEIEDKNPWSGVELGPAKEDTPAGDPPGDPPKVDPPADPPPDLPESGAATIGLDPKGDKAPLEDPLDGYSEAALAARVLKETRSDLFGDDLNKELSWDGLVNKLDNYIAETLKAGEKVQVERIGQANQYVDFLLKGGSAESLQDALQYADLAHVDVTQADDSVLKEIITADLASKEVDPDTIETVIKTAELAGKLNSKATELQQSLLRREKNRMEIDLQRKTAADQQASEDQESLKTEIGGIIDGDQVMGYLLNDNLRTELREMIFTPTVVIKQEVNGQMVTRKITKFEKLKSDFDSSLDKQIAFALLLSRNFDLSSLISEGKQQKDSSLMEELRKRGSDSNLSKVQGTNAYLNEE